MGPKWMAGHDLTTLGREIFRGAGTPVFGSVSAAARAIGRICATNKALAPVTSRDLRMLPAGAQEAVRAVAAGQRVGEDLLDLLGVAHPSVTLARSAEEATAAAERIGGPVAVKVHAPGLLHKTEVGGVALNLASSEVAAAYDRITSAARSHAIDNVEGVTVHEMIPRGVEILLALTSRGDGYPPIVTVGFGGVTTEIYRDLVSAPAPVTPDQAGTMLRALMAWPLLDGFRGSAPVNVTAAAEMISRFSDIAEVASRVPMEVEVNPLIVGGTGAQAADIIVTLR
jgi:acyl-CoA synthetase (NDP forming)